MIEFALAAAAYGPIGRLSAQAPKFDQWICFWSMVRMPKSPGLSTYGVLMRMVRSEAEPSATNFTGPMRTNSLPSPVTTPASRSIW